MSAFPYLLRRDLRRGLKPLVVVALLAGLAGGAAMASAAAARRTETTFGRMRRSTGAWDLLVNPNDGSQSRLSATAIGRLRGVAAVGRVDGMEIYPSFVRSVSEAFDLAPMLVTDAEATHTVGRPVVTAGRQPSADDPDGVWAERSFARQMHLHVGQSFDYVLLTPELLQRMQASQSLSAAAAVLRSAPSSLRGRARIEGIGITQDGVIVNPGYLPAGLVFSPAFSKAHPALQRPYWGAMVRLEPGTNVNDFVRRVQALAPNESIAFQHASAVASEVRTTTDPDALALYLFAGIVAVLGIVVVGQAISRWFQADATRNAALSAVGMTRRQRAATSWATAAGAILLGVALAIGIAIAASPLGPVGAVRIAEVHPGVHADWATIGLGALAMLVAGVAVAAIPAWRWARVASNEFVPRRSRAASLCARLGGSVAAVVGLRFAFERTGGRGSPTMRPTFVAAAAAVALVAAVIVFSSSLDHLLATPRLFGSSWDGQIELDNLNTPGGFGNPDPAELVSIERQFMQVADHSGSIAASAIAYLGEIRSRGVSVPALGFARRMGTVAPTVAAGRAPRTAHEVALGSATMAALHTGVGRTMTLARDETGRDVTVRVVGRAVLPGLAPYPGSDKAGLGTGALLTAAGWREFSRDFQKTEYVFRWAPGHSVHSLTRTFSRDMPSQLPLSVGVVNLPAGVVSAQRLRATPTLLTALLVVMLAAAVANALLATVRRRTRDLAVLRALGFTRGQTVRAVLWQASIIAAVAVGIGIPLGLAIGRWGWTVLADRLGALAVPTVPAVSVAGVAVAAIVIANVVALAPGLRAALNPPVLRSE